MSRTASSVNCPITGAKFILVKSDNADSLNQFKMWVKNLIKRAYSGKMINIAFDCEGFNLGSYPHSLGCIQIGEIFDDSFDIKLNSNPPNVGQKKGFIVFTPFNDETKANLNRIFKHRNIIYYTFEFTIDLCAFLDAGITVNYYNLFDSQVVSSGDAMNFLFNPKIRGLKWFVTEAKGMDPFSEKALTLLNEEKRMYFDVAAFLFKDLSNPEHELLKNEFIESAAADVYMTGLAALYCIKSGLTQKVFNATQIKLREFNQFIQMCGSVLAPSIGRELALFNVYRASFYERDVRLNDRTDHDLKNLLQVFRECKMIINASHVLKSHYFGKIPENKASEIYNIAVEKLNANKQRLEEMMSSIFE